MEEIFRTFKFQKSFAATTARIRVRAGECRLLSHCGCTSTKVSGARCEQSGSRTLSAQDLEAHQGFMRLGLIGGHLDRFLRRNLHVGARLPLLIRSEQMAEEVLGIQCYVNDVPGFSGVLKHR